MKLKNNLIALGAIILLMIVLFFLGRWTAPIKVEYKDKPLIDYRVETKVDTVWIKQAPIYIQGKGVVIIDTVNQKDTVYMTKPFVARLDTIYKDTISVKYAYPLNRFDLSIRFKSDSIIRETQTITITKEKLIERAWWVDVLTHVGAGAVGYGVGRFK